MTDADDVALNQSALFRPPVRDGELLPFSRAAPPVAAPAPRRPLVAPPLVAARPEQQTAIREQIEARRLCGQLRASDRCPGECVTSQLARGVPLRELRGRDAFDEL